MLLLSTEPKVENSSATPKIQYQLSFFNIWWKDGQWNMDDVGNANSFHCSPIEKYVCTCRMGVCFVLVHINVCLRGSS